MIDAYSLWMSELLAFSNHRSDRLAKISRTDGSLAIISARPWTISATAGWTGRWSHEVELFFARVASVVKRRLREKPG